MKWSWPMWRPAIRISLFEELPTSVLTGSDGRQVPPTNWSGRCPMGFLKNLFRPRELKPTIDNKDGSTLVLIPSGIFMFADVSVHVELHGFYLAAHAITNWQFERYVRETGAETPWNARAGPDHPAVNVTWYEARAYCKWAGLRLPTALEWEKGARGRDGIEYPWGDRWDDDMCRTWTNRGMEETSVVAGYPQGRSPYGLFQMVGNTWEWCDNSHGSLRYVEKRNEQHGRLLLTGSHR